MTISFILTLSPLVTVTVMLGAGMIFNPWLLTKAAGKILTVVPVFSRTVVVMFPLLLVFGSYGLKTAMKNAYLPESVLATRPSPWMWHYDPMIFLSFLSLVGPYVPALCRP